MKTLSTLFSEERNQLQTEIDKITSVEQVVQLVENRLDNLERIYTLELNVAQIRLATFFLDTLRHSMKTLTAANLTQVTYPLQKEITKVVINSPDKLILKVLQALICIGIFGSLFSYTKTTPAAWMAILLTSVLLGLEVAIQLDKHNRENNSSDELKLPEAIVRVDSKVFLDNLADAFNTIDLAVARVEESNKHQQSNGIEELPELLNFLQRLIGASKLDKPQMAIELTKLLPQILMDQGICAIAYQPSVHTSREYFDFEPSIDPDTKDYVTITPALLKGDRLLKRGRVIEPVSSPS